MPDTGDDRVSRRAVSVALLAAVLITGAAAFLAPRLLDRGGAPSIGGPFALLDQAGHTITDRDFRGRWMLIYFGYTHCPDACPTALSDMAEALSRLGAKRADVAPIFITIDPERDTPDVVGKYVAAFDSSITGLSGSQAQIDAAAHQFRVYASKHQEKDGGYSMDHSSLIYIIDPKGELAGLLGGEADAASIVTKLTQLGV